MTTGTHIDNAALFGVLSSLADNKQAIGRRYAYWCNGAPALEAAVAAAAMTQDELGHARTLYPLLEDFTQAEADPRQVEPTTRTLRYSVTALDADFAGWSDFVATNFLLDSALTTFFEAAQDFKLRTAAPACAQGCAGGAHPLPARRGLGAQVGESRGRGTSGSDRSVGTHMG